MKPALVLIHGAVLNGGMWAPIAADLGRDFKVVTPDLPGHGTRAGEPFRLDTAVAMVREIAQSLAPSPIVLCGDSLGGYVSLASAASLGDQLKGAVLGGCTGNFQGPVILLLKAQMALGKLASPAKLKSQLEARILKEKYEAGPAILAGGISPESFAVAVRELQKVDFRAVLASITVPLVFVNGSRDWAHTLGERGTLAANPRATLRRFPGTGHGVTIIRPAEFTAIVREFVSLTIGD